MRAKIVTVGLCAVLLAGCGGPDEQPPVQQPSQPTQSQAPQAEATATAAERAEPIAKATFDTRGGSVEVAVLGLEIRGRLAQLSMQITPAADALGVTGIILFGRPDMYATLIDPVNLKRYKVVKDSTGKLLGDGNPAIKPGAPSTLNFTFAAPPQDVTKVDVQYGDFPPFRDIAITR